MNQSSSIIHNQLHEMTVSVNRAYHVKCNSSWHSDDFIPSFSSIGLIIDGEGTMWCSDYTEYISREKTLIVYLI